MKKSVICIFISAVLNSCFQNNTKFNDKHPQFSDKQLLKIELYLWESEKPIEVSKKPIFSITDENELKKAILEIQNANDAGLWKGAGWDKLKLYYKDTTITLNTDKSRIGTLASGGFYKLEENNFISRQLHK